MNSPLYKGKGIWDTLDVNVQRTDTIDSFVKQVKPNFMVYCDCLNM